MHPLTSTRTALQNLLGDALTDMGVDVLNWYSQEYGSSTALVIGDVRGEVTRDRFARATRLPFMENAEIDIRVFPTGAEYNWDEEGARIFDILDVCISTLGANYTLGGEVEGLVRCTPDSYTIGPDEGHLVGHFVVLCQYRIDRRTS